MFQKGGFKIKIVEVIILYIKGFLTEKEFENWVYNNSEQIENQVDKELYFDLISTSYTNKIEVISLKNKLINLVEKNYKLQYDNINDEYVERQISENKNDGIWSIIQKKYERKKEMVLDFQGIDSSKKLHIYLKLKFELSDYYGRNWDAFEDLLYGDIKFPYKIIIKNDNYLLKHLPQDFEIFKELIMKHRKDCQILFD